MGRDRGGAGKASHISRDAVLRAAIAERLGHRVELMRIDRGDSLLLVWVRLPDLPVGESLALKEWVYTELKALQAEQTDGLALIPAYDA